MADDFERLNIILAARDREFARAMDRNTRRIERFARDGNKNLSSLSAKWDGLAGSVKGLLPALSAAAVIAQTRSVIANLDNIGKTADKLGLTTDALQELRTAAESAGVSQNTFDMAMQRFGRRLAEARQGTGEAVKALQEMGVSIRDAGGNALPLENVLGQVADKMAGMSSQTDRNRLAMKLFDSEGVVMVNLLREGAGGIDEMRAEARRLGIVIEESLIRGAEDAQTQLDLMARVINANLATALINLAPLLVSAASGVARISGAVRDFLSIGYQMPNVMSADEIRAAAAGYDGLWRELGRVNQAQSAYDANVEKYGSDSLQAAAWARQLAEAQKELAEGLAQKQAAQEASDRAASTIRGIGAETEAARAAAEARAMGAEAAERERIAREATAKQDAILADLATANGGAVTDEARANVAALVEQWQAAQVAQSLVLNPPKVEDGGAGGAVAAAAAQAADLVATLDELVGEHVAAALASEEQRAALARLNAEYRAGQIDAEAYRVGVQSLKSDMDRLKDTARDIAGGFEDMAVSIVTGAESAGDAVAGLLQMLAQMAAKAAFAGLFDGIGAALAPVFTPDAPSFAGGGGTGSGVRAGGVDGKGGFWAILHPDETVIDHTRPGGGLAGVPSFDGGGYTGPGLSPLVRDAGTLAPAAPRAAAGVALSFAPVIDARGADAAAVDRLQAQLDAMARDFEGRVVGAVKTAKMRRIL